MDHVRQHNVLVLCGALDVRCTAELRDVLYAMLEEHLDDVVVDLTGVSSVDTTTLKLLAVASRSAQRQGHRVVLRRPNDGVRRLLHLTHLRGMLHVEPVAGVTPAL